VDKLKSLKKALLYSYQAATAVLSDGREFRCLINPNKLSVDLDNKILSIPFKDICLNTDRIGTTSQGEVETGVKEGDVIEWKENSSHWIVYLQRLEETAYFRADLRRCRHQIALDNGKKYWVYVRGPVEKNIAWMQGGGNYINKLNNTLQMYITQNEETLNYFHRFSKIKLNGNTWEVQAVDSISTPGLIEIALKEDSNNTPKDDLDKAVQDSINVVYIDERQEEYIHGPKEVYPYETHSYELKNSDLTNGYWQLSNMSRKNAAKIVSFDESKVIVSILTGKSAKIQLDFVAEERQVSLPIEIKSL
jgi:hypothetical protein